MVSLKPILGITMGDPSGIGPEITVKAFYDKNIYEICRPVVIGDAATMEKALAIVGGNLHIKPVSAIGAASFIPGTMDVYDLKNVDQDELRLGVVSPMAGNAAFQAVTSAIDLAMKKKLDGTVTCPLNKEALNLAGHHFAGHTEIYAQYTGSKDSVMLLVAKDLKVAHVSTHVSLRDACDRVKKERVLRVIVLLNEACMKLGIAHPKIGVAGLNPHAGENGLFGWEEEREIIPAIQQAKDHGLLVEGPVPPDTVFAKARGGQYDAVVAMYHDQGHIPVKLVGFRLDKKSGEWQSVSGVNITLGIPIIRTSVDHGTAFDIAGKGIATAESLMHAIEFAARMASPGF